MPDRKKTRLPEEIRFEVMDDRVAAVFAAMTPARRLQIAFEMWDFTWNMLRLNLLREHPDWDAERIRREMVRRINPDAVRFC